MLEWRRRSWLTGVGAAALACERTRSPTDDGAATGGTASTPVPRDAKLTRVGALDPTLGAPLQIVIGPAGDRVLVVMRGGFAVWAGDAMHARPRGGIADRRALASADGWLVGAQRFDARGEPGATLRGAGILDETGVRQLALGVDGDAWITAVAVQGPERPLALVVTRRSASGGPRWTFEQPGRAAAAIDGGFVIAIATFDGRVRVLGDPPGDAEAPAVLVDVGVDPPGYAIAFDRSGISLLTAPRIDEHRDGGLRIAAPPDWRPDGTWSTVLVELGPDGRERARTSLAFAGLQAPVRLHDGSTAVVGLGAARIADGRAVWTRASNLRVHACAAGRDLVLVHGTSVERLDDAGLVQSADTVTDGTIACPPAVAADGSVWIATTTALWRL